MNVAHEISAVAQDYLKVIWAASEWRQDPVTTKALAARMGVSASTVSEAVRRLTDQGMVEHRPYGSIELTPAGTTLALQVVRRHRILETYLVSELGYTWDEAHDDAEILEHAASDRLIERIDAKLGRPGRDPHGDPIPTADGTVTMPAAVQLATLADGQRGHVARISDAEPDMLRYFASVGIALDTRVDVVERRDYAGVLAVRLDAAAAPVDLGVVAAEAIWVVPAD